MNIFQDADVEAALRIRELEGRDALRSITAFEMEKRMAELEGKAASARKEALEEAAKVAERDADWTRFGKQEVVQQFEGGYDSIREYRLGIIAGRAIAAAIRALASKEPT